MYPSYKLAFPDNPKSTTYSEAVYTKAVSQGEMFYLKFDLSWDRDCHVDIQRYVTGSNGVDYLVSEDSRTIIKNQRMKYIVEFPIGYSIPIGPATVWSNLSFSCDWFSSYIRSLKVKSLQRSIIVLPGKRNS
jgi:hypothetical protein